MLDESAFPEQDAEQEIVDDTRDLERQQLAQQQLLRHQRLPLTADVSEQVVLPEQLSSEDESAHHSSDLALATAATLRELSGQVNTLPTTDGSLGSTDGFESNAQDPYMQLSAKRLVDVLSPPLGIGVAGLDVGPERKRRKTTTEQHLKRHKYDILKAFFRIYFAESKEGMVLKDSIFSLYAKKIPEEQRIARNAMYRHMWSFFRGGGGEKITAFQSNYREYIKGIKLITSEVQMSYDGVDKDLEVLHSVGVFSLFDFQEDDLEKSDKVLTVLHGARVGGDSSDTESAISVTTEDREEDNGSTGLIGSSVEFPQPPQNEDSLLGYVERLEQTAVSLVASLRELRQRLKNRGEKFG